MSNWPRREHGWEAALLERVRQLLIEFAHRNALRIDWSDSPPGTLDCTIPAQTGLDFTLWFAFSEDEITFGFGDEEWFADIFPLDDPEKWQRMSDTIDGLITGETRVLLYRALGRKKPYWSAMQRRSEGRWQSISTGIGCAIPPIIRSTILRNGYPPQSGPVRPAWGSLVIWSGLAASLYHFLA